MATVEDSVSTMYRNRRMRYAVLLGEITVILLMIAMCMCMIYKLFNYYDIVFQCVDSQNYVYA